MDPLNCEQASLSQRLAKQPSVEPPMACQLHCASREASKGGSDGGGRPGDRQESRQEARHLVALRSALRRSPGLPPALARSSVIGRLSPVEAPARVGAYRRVPGKSAGVGACHRNLREARADGVRVSARPYCAFCSRREKRLPARREEPVAEREADGRSSGRAQTRVTESARERSPGSDAVVARAALAQQVDRGLSRAALVSRAAGSSAVACAVRQVGWRWLPAASLVSLSAERCVLGRLCEGDAGEQKDEQR